MKHTWEQIQVKAGTWVLGVYIAAGSLVGFEVLIIVFSYATAWPIAIPFVVAGLAVFYYVRQILFRKTGRTTDEIDVVNANE